MSAGARVRGEGAGVRGIEEGSSEGEGHGGRDAVCSGRRDEDGGNVE